MNVPGLHNQIIRVPPVTAAPAPYAAVFTCELAQCLRHGLHPRDAGSGALPRHRTRTSGEAYTDTFRQL
ncbi:MAG: hypothetical protein QM736_15195 [Vicinamibacterales bacterium]